MAISRELIKAKLIQAIKQLPTYGLVVRCVCDSRNEVVGYKKVSNLEGVFYTEENNKNIKITLADKGILNDNECKNYLVVFDIESEKVKKLDYVFIDNKCYKIREANENMKIYQIFKLEEYQGMELVDDKIMFNREVHQLMEYIELEYTL